MKKWSILLTTLVVAGGPAQAEWGFSGAPTPNAFVQSGDMTVELQCDRIRFAPAAYEDAQDIVAKQGLSIRFMKNGSTEAGAFQVGSDNASVGIVDNFPVEIVFLDAADHSFVLDGIARNAVLNLSMIDREVTYGLFDLKGSGAAVRALRAACGSGAAPASSASTESASMEAPEGIVYCGGGGITRQIEYAILAQRDGEWDAIVTVNGESQRAMTAYSYFGNSPVPKGFQVALLLEDRGEMLVFSDAGENWLEYGDYTYHQCN
ncbi:hypothetical protein OEZ60_11680 [Defluviimonas sp. WL0024]|uniref:Uncharacterized protein n=1 Tax=Albidovulum salinarum TaxID=2984153 RepID=A0ABT2XA74_9RHOB|nr:hypothetical protein [Defluviimonas sp. WL0024]MCU9848665.1 hypothetical protein [Defluviimonas sp. WL0024]